MTYILYIILFFSLYIQVFFLFSFLKNRKNLLNKEISSKGVNIKNQPEVTFLLPCWNEEKTVKRTVESIFALDYPKEKIFLIIVDDGSTDKTWQILSSFKDLPNVKIIKKENGGKASALNLGLEYVTTELVSSVDADTIFDKNALREIVQFYCENDVVAVGGSVLIDNPTSLIQEAQSVEYKMNAYFKKMLGFTGGVLVAPGAFSLFATEAVRKIGGYRNAHNLEDLELTFRMQVNNMKVDHCHTAFAFTKGPATLKKFFKQRLRWSRGFLGNLLEYKKAIFNKKLGNFGMFSLPMGAINYFVIFYVFVWSWFYLVRNIWFKIEEYNLVGFDFGGSLNALVPDFFFFDSRAIAFLVPSLYLFFLFSIFMGMRFARKKISLLSFLSYSIVYSVLPPFWVLKSVYYTIISKIPAWR